MSINGSHYRFAIPVCSRYRLTRFCSEAYIIRKYYYFLLPKKKAKLIGGTRKRYANLTDTVGLCLYPLGSSVLSSSLQHDSGKKCSKRSLLSFSFIHFGASNKIEVILNRGNFAPIIDYNVLSNIMQY